MLTKYGVDNIIFFFLVSIILIVLGLLNFGKFYSLLSIAFGVVIIIFTFIFFRDPERKIPTEALLNDCIVLSPADGEITEIINIFEEKYLNSDAIRISIFLSPLDAHVNRSPSNGTVKYFEYIKGKYIVAYKSESSKINEQTIIGIENSCGKIVFKQIVGVLARRLVWDIKLNDKLTAGQKFGMMKFGSRMDIFLPLNSKILVGTGQKVIAGESILATINKHKGSEL